MDSSASKSIDIVGSKDQKQHVQSSAQSSKDSTGVFDCAYCSLHERYDYKGSKPPFARQLVYSEDCYLMKDPFSLPNKGEVLVLGADCSICKKPVCLGCSVYFGKRFCSKCAVDNMNCMPSQLHAKIRSLIKDTTDS